jgi:hypothetical protein
MGDTTDVFVYASGLIYCSACAPEDMPKEEVEKLVNLINPSGVSNWTIAEEPFADGKPNPSKCDKYSSENRLHHLLSC